MKVPDPLQHVPALMATPAGESPVDEQRKAMLHVCDQALRLGGTQSEVVEVLASLGLMSRESYDTAMRTLSAPVVSEVELCRNGAHPMTPENVRWRATHGRPTRVCRGCERARRLRRNTGRAA